MYDAVRLLLRGVLRFLRQIEALPLRSAGRACRDAVAEHVWEDWCSRHSLIRGSLAAWRSCFPHALSANLVKRADLQDADMLHLQGVRMLAIDGCTSLTDAGLAPLAGSIHTLTMRDCVRLTAAGTAHLRGIYDLTMDGCTAIADEGLAHLSGIHTLSMSRCVQITDAGLAHLRGTLKLTASQCTGFTDAGLAALRDASELTLLNCTQLTNRLADSLRGGKAPTQTLVLGPWSGPRCTHAFFGGLRLERMVIVLVGVRIDALMCKALSGTMQVLLGNCAVPNSAVRYLKGCNSVGLVNATISSEAIHQLQRANGKVHIRSKSEGLM